MFFRRFCWMLSSVTRATFTHTTGNYNQYFAENVTFSNLIWTLVKLFGIFSRTLWRKICLIAPIYEILSILSDIHSNTFSGEMSHICMWLPCSARVVTWLLSNVLRHHSSARIHRNSSTRMIPFQAYFISKINQAEIFLRHISDKSWFK